MNISKIIIAGPCAAESKEQLFETAKGIFNTVYQNEYEPQNPNQKISDLKKTTGVVSSWNLDFFRCGIWKPRTNPKDFQGVGNIAFKWLKEIKEQFGFKICVEVASVEHVKFCLENNIDAIWIGARTTVNPFLVQTIADSVQNLPLTVLVKNPINPDINLWTGAIQRFKNVGIRNVIAIHRGFSVEHENVYRYAPCWEIPIAMKLKLSNIPIICDISHIAGNVPLQQTIAQTAMNYGFEGLMAEVHNAPETALSDRQQQLLPSQFVHLLQSINFAVQKNDADHALFIQRNLIKNIDIQISKLLSKRMEVVDEIATIKNKNALPALQPEQWKKVVTIYEKNALEDENYKQFLEDFLLLLHKSSLKRQR